MISEENTVSSHPETQTSHLVNLLERAHQVLAKRWQDLWQKFQRRVQLPVSPEWTASDYAASLPSHWPPAWQAAVRDFLHQYNRYRFAPPDAEHFIQVEQALERCLRTLAVTKPDSKDPLP